MPLNVVFDTNVLLSGIGWRGRPYQCLELARRGRVDALTCPEILDELDRILRTKLQFSDEHALATRADLLSFLRLVTITNTLHVVTDDTDRPRRRPRRPDCAPAGRTARAELVLIMLMRDDVCAPAAQHTAGEYTSAGSRREGQRDRR